MLESSYKNNNDIKFGEMTTPDLLRKNTELPLNPYESFDGKADSKLSAAITKEKTRNVESPAILCKEFNWADMSKRRESIHS